MSQDSSTKLFIAYYRVSTDKQGRSGLGLEAQKESVRRYVEGLGELHSEYTEVESGRRDDRTELSKAVSHSRSVGATLVIAKLDRLARNVRFTAALMESGADFIAVDMPSASKLVIHILAAMAEEEARATSKRTKEALAAYKARGGKLGSHHPRCKKIGVAAGAKGSRRGGDSTRRKAVEASEHVVPVMKELREQGKSLRKIAEELNGRGFITRQGRPWNATQVKRVLDRQALVSN